MKYDYEFTANTVAVTNNSINDTEKHSNAGRESTPVPDVTKIKEKVDIENVKAADNNVKDNHDDDDDDEGHKNNAFDYFYFAPNFLLEYLYIHICDRFYCCILPPTALLPMWEFAKDTDYDSDDDEIAS